MDENKIDPIGYALIFSFLALLVYAGYLSLKSIDFEVLRRMETHQLILPTPLPTTTPQP